MATVTALALPTVKRHLDGCPGDGERQEIFDTTYPTTHRLYPGQRVGVARCKDCGTSDLIEFAQVASYRTALERSLTNA